MRRLIRVTRVLLPLLVAAAAAGVRLQVGETRAGLVLMMLGGGLLGASAALMLESVAVLLGWLRQKPAISQRRSGELKSELQTLLRSIKDIDTEIAMQRLDAEQGAKLAAPLRSRALELLRGLEQTRLQLRAGFEEQVEREIALRLDAGDGAGKPAEEGTP